MQCETKPCTPVKKAGTENVKGGQKQFNENQTNHKGGQKSHNPKKHRGGTVKSQGPKNRNRDTITRELINAQDLFANISKTRALQDLEMRRGL